MLLKSSGHFAAQLAAVMTDQHRYIQSHTFVVAEGDPAAWPGPKAWPASLILVSFFSVNICFGALLKALDPVVLDNVPPLNWLSLLSF